MENQNPQGQQGDQNEQKNKDEKKFQTALSDVTNMVGGKANLRLPTKVGKGKLAKIVAEMFSKEVEKVEAEVEKELHDLLKNYLESEKATAIEEKKLADFKLTKKKEFTEKANKLKQKIEQTTLDQKQYEETLKSAFGAKGLDYKGDEAGKAATPIDTTDDSQG